MEMKSPPPCPPTVTIRRNPYRRTRDTPLREQLSSPSISRNIFTDQPTSRHPKCDNGDSGPASRPSSENLKVYLRVRPVLAQKSRRIADSKNAWPKNPKTKSSPKLKTVKCPGMCVTVNEDLRSVTVSTPEALVETKRVKSEVYGGFSHVFACESSQSDVYEIMVKPLVEDFIKGKSGMLAAMGPSGSGKTHTVFGCARDPGMVSLALHHIFREDECNGSPVSKVFYMSICEISSEKGKERITDLLHDEQHAVLKGLKEAVVCDAQQAETVIARGMLKRSTATTNSNAQSSRSQCITSIRYNSEEGDEEGDDKANSTRLMIVDLAGAEREKKTGHQGIRLLESNFINNTSMVFGLCLRSLLEHQKNPNKPLPKHYQNSLLTRSMRDYLEGKKRMTLILTVKPGLEDYLDTSFLLRQASPFTKIKFHTLVEQPKLTCTKRPSQALPRAQQLKKMKLSKIEAYVSDEPDADRCFQQKEITGNKVKDDPSQSIKSIHDEHLHQIHVQFDVLPELDRQQKRMHSVEYNRINAEKDREFKIMQGLSKAFWAVLKEYKVKVQRVDVENCHLKESLAKEKKTNLDLQNRLISNNNMLSDLENELKELKSCCKCFTKASADIFPLPQKGASSDLSQCQATEYLEVNSESSSYSLKEMEPSQDEQCDGISIVGRAADIEADSADANGFKDTNSVALHSKSEEISACFNDVHSSNSCEDTIMEEGRASKVESVIVGSSAGIEEDATEANGFYDTNLKALHSRSKEHSACIDDAHTSNSFEDTSIDGERRASGGESVTNIVVSAADIEVDGVDVKGGVDDTNSVALLLSTDDEAHTSNSCEDAVVEGEGTGSSGESIIQLRNACVSKSEVDILMDSKHLESDSELASSLESESLTQYYEAVDVSFNDTNSVALLPRTDDAHTSNSFEDTGIEGERRASGVKSVTNIVRSAADIEVDAVDVEGGADNTNSVALLPSTDDEAHTSNSCEDAVVKGEGTGSSGESIIQLRNACVSKSEVDILKDSKHLESDSKLASSLESESLTQYYEAVDVSFNDTNSVALLPRTDDPHISDCCVDTIIEGEGKAFGGESVIQLRNASVYPSRKSELDILMDSKHLESDGELASSLESKSPDSTQYYEDQTNSSEEPTKQEDCSSDESGLQIEGISIAINSHNTNNSSELQVDEEKFSHEKKKGDLDPLIIALCKDGRDAPSSLPNSLSCCNPENKEKPRRRLQPSSSILVKDISIFDIKDINDKPKGTKSGKSVTTLNDKNRTQGNASLFNLLTSKLEW